MVLVSWVALLAGGILAGLGPVAAMAWPPESEPIAVAGTLAAGAASIAGLIGIALLSGRVDEVIVAAVLGIGTALGGFALGAAVLAQIGPDAPPAVLPDPLPPASPRTAVLLLSEAEPERYSARQVARELRDLGEQEVALPPEPMRPFIFASEKARYRSIGGSSPARETSRRVAERLAADLDDGFSGVTATWSDDEPTLDQALAFVVAHGARSVVIAELAVAEDAAIAWAKRRADALRSHAAGVRVAYARPLWASQLLAERLVARIIDAAGDGSLQTLGVALLGHGQPAELERVNSVRTEQETYFQQRVRSLLVEAGLDENHVRPGWIEWQEPGVTEVVRHLAALGCRRILVVPASMPADSRTTLIDLPDAVQQARVDATARVRVLPAWGDDPVVAEALAEAVREAAAEL